MPRSPNCSTRAAAADDEQPFSLTDQELEELSFAFTSAPFHLDLPWIVSERRHAMRLECTAEISRALGRTNADEWARTSGQFAEQLEGSRVCLGRGIEIVGNWLKVVRRYYDAIQSLVGSVSNRAVNASAEPSGSSSDLQTVIADIAEMKCLLIGQRTFKEFYTTAEAAEMLGKAEFTVREWCRHGRVKAQKQGSGRGKHQAWVISNGELQRLQREGLLPLLKH